MYSALIIVYLFLGGTAAGAYFVMSTWGLRFYRGWRIPPSHERRAFDALQARVFTIAFALMIVAALCLVFDLTKPERALLLFLRPRPTAVTFGAFAIAAQLALGMALVVAHVLKPYAIAGSIKRALDVLCTLISLCVMGYTGFYLANQAAVPLWNTLTLPVLFVFSSLSCGISAVLLVCYLCQGHVLLDTDIKPLQRTHLGVLACEALSLWAFANATLGNAATATSVQLLLEPTMFQTACIGVLGMGLAAPLCLETYALLSKRPRTIPVSDVVCLIGSLCLRYCVVMCGVH